MTIHLVGISNLENKLSLTTLFINRYILLSPRLRRIFLAIFTVHRKLPSTLFESVNRHEINQKKLLQTFTCNLFQLVFQLTTCALQSSAISSSIDHFWKMWTGHLHTARFWSQWRCLLFRVFQRWHSNRRYKSKSAFAFVFCIWRFQILNIVFTKSFSLKVFRSVSSVKIVRIQTLDLFRSFRWLVNSDRLAR